MQQTLLQFLCQPDTDAQPFQKCQPLMLLAEACYNVKSIIQFLIRTAEKAIFQHKKVLSDLRTVYGIPLHIPHLKHFQQGVGAPVAIIRWILL